MHNLSNKQSLKQLTSNLYIYYQLLQLMQAYDTSIETISMGFKYIVYKWAANLCIFIKTNPCDNLVK